MRDHSVKSTSGVHGAYLQFRTKEERAVQPSAVSKRGFAKLRTDDIYFLSLTTVNNCVPSQSYVDVP